MLFFYNIFKKLFLIISLFLFVTACNGIPGADARKFPANPEERVKKNLAEGKGVTFMDLAGQSGNGGKFEFASSNPLWRASLDVIDFMPLSSVNYSGGIIITDWYADENDPTESIKINIRFLTNEVRSDSLDIKVYNRKCIDSLINCKIIQTDQILVNELKKEILKKATIYEKQVVAKRRKNYQDK